MVINNYSVTLNDDLDVFINMNKIHDNSEILENICEYKLLSDKLVVYFVDSDLDKLIFKNLNKDAHNVIKNRLGIYINEIKDGLNKNKIKNEDIIMYPSYKSA